MRKHLHGEEQAGQEEGQGLLPLLRLDAPRELAQPPPERQQERGQEVGEAVAEAVEEEAAVVPELGQLRHGLQHAHQVSSPPPPPLPLLLAGRSWCGDGRQRAVADQEVVRVVVQPRLLVRGAVPVVWLVEVDSIRRKVCLTQRIPTQTQPISHRSDSKGGSGHSTSKPPRAHASMKSVLMMTTTTLECPGAPSVLAGTTCGVGAAASAAHAAAWSSPGSSSSSSSSAAASASPIRHMSGPRCWWASTKAWQKGRKAASFSCILDDVN